MFRAERSGDRKWVAITNEDEAAGGPNYFDAIEFTLDTDDRSAEVASDETVQRIVSALNREFYPDKGSDE